MKIHILNLFGIVYGKKLNKLINNTKINILVMTNFHIRFLESLGFDTKKIQIYRNPINNSSVNEYNQNSKYIVYAGRISSDKGVEELLNSWAETGISDLSLKIVGDGPLLEYLSKKYKSINIEFLGQLTHDETLE